MSTSSQVPSGARAARMAPIHLLWLGHVVDAVEGRDEVERVVIGQRVGPDVVEARVGQPFVGSPLLGQDQRVA